MSSSLDSGEINRLIDAFQICTVSVSMRERQEMAHTAIRMFSQLTSFGNDTVKTRVVSLPGLLASLARLCRLKALLKKSQQFVLDIGWTVFCLCRNNPARADVVDNARQCTLYYLMVHITVEQLSSLLEPKQLCRRP